MRLCDGKTQAYVPQTTHSSHSLALAQLMCWQDTNLLLLSFPSSLLPSPLPLLPPLPSFRLPLSCVSPLIVWPRMCSSSQPRSSRGWIVPWRGCQTHSEMPSRMVRYIQCFYLCYQCFCSALMSHLYFILYKLHSNFVFCLGGTIFCDCQ